MIKKNVNFYNPFSIQENFLIKVYKYISTPSKNSISLKFKFILEILFKRISFAFINMNISLNTKAKYKDIVFDARSTNSQFHSIYFDEHKDCYEPDVLAVLECFLPIGGVFVDIGSNWGHHSFIALIEKNANIYSFEPNEKVFNDLKNIKNFIDSNSRMKIFNHGCGSEEKNLVLKQLNFESGNASSNKNFLLNKGSRVSFFEKVINLMTFKKSIDQDIYIKKLDDSVESDLKVDLIKIDVEGNELDCLLGAKNVIRRSRPYIVFEVYTDDTGTIDDFETFFSKFEYNLYEIFPQITKNECSFKLISSLKSSKHYNIIASPERF